MPLVTLVRAEEIDRIIDGDDDDLRAAPIPVAKKTRAGIVLLPSDRDSMCKGSRVLVGGVG